MSASGPSGPLVLDRYFLYLFFQKFLCIFHNYKTILAGSDNNHAHPDTSMELGRNVH